MKSSIEIFESGILEGIVSRNKKFYDERLSQEEINKIFLDTRIRLGNKFHFDGKKIFQAKQKKESNPNDYPDGKYVVLTDEYMKKDDFWYEEIPADILIISSKYPNIVVGNQMADCPILIIEDRRLKVTALSHCGATYINRNLPVQTIECLEKEFSSNMEDLYVYIGSCAKKESYIYDTYPTWATNKKIWEKNIIEVNGKYHIDLISSIVQALKEKGLKHIEVSEKDTITDPKFYSHYASSRGNKKKLGQNFVGFFYK